MFDLDRTGVSNFGDIYGIIKTIGVIICFKNILKIRTISLKIFVTVNDELNVFKCSTCTDSSCNKVINYFVNLIFVIVNIYCVKIKKFAKYHSYAAARDATILGVQLTVYYILGNLRTIKFLHLLIAIYIAAVLIYVARKMTILMERICPYVCSE